MARENRNNQRTAYAVGAARLFSPADDRGTKLLRGEDGDNLCIDRWDSRAAGNAFRGAFADEYEDLDRASQTLTVEETPLGCFGSLG